MGFKLKNGVSLGLALALALGALGCSKKSDQKGVLRMTLKDDVKTLDPVNAYDSVSSQVIYQIYDTLLQYNYGEEKMVLEPSMADGMPTWSKDGKVMTLKLKKGILFQDDPAFKANGGKGREVKIQDFVFGFKRHAIPKLQSIGAWIFDGRVKGFKEFSKKLSEAKKEDFQKVFDEPVEGFKVIDDYTMELHFIEPYPIFNYLLAMTFTSPVPVEAVQAYADSDGNLRDRPIGSGPYVLKSWETNQRIVIEKNPNYKGVYPSSGSESLKAKGLFADAGKSLPLTSKIQFEIIKEDQPRLLKFQKGEMDLLELSKDSFRSTMVDGQKVNPELEKAKISPVFEESTLAFYVFFNTKDKILSNKILRQAIASAIDRQKWIDTFYTFRGKILNEVNPPGIVDRIEAKSNPFDFNLERAKALLAKAGYPEGKGLPVLSFDFRGADTISRQMGEFFVQSLGQVGIKVNPVLNTFPAYLEKAKQGNLQIAIGGWNWDYPDVENGFQLLYGPNKAPGPNDSNFENAEFDALYRKLAAMPAGAPGRKEIVQKLEKIVTEESPWAYGFSMTVYWLKQERVKNFRVAETINNKLKYIGLNEETAK